MNIKEKLEEGWLHCRVIIEIAGKPKEHVEKTAQDYVEKLKKEKDMLVVKETIAELKKQDTGAKEEGTIKEMWITFIEMEILFKSPMVLTYFCFDYMPSMIEVLAPEKLTFEAKELGDFFNDLQARLHQVNIIVKQLQSKAPFLNKNIRKLLENFLILIFKSGKTFTSGELAKMTGVSKERIEDLLDIWLDKNWVEMEEDKYRFKK